MLSSNAVPCRCRLKNFYLTKINNVQCKEKLQPTVITKQAAAANKMGKVVPRIGKTCDKGHRWLCSKTIADVMEALIGAYLFEGGASAAVHFMVWAGIDVAFDFSLIEEASRRASVDLSINPGIDIGNLEQRIGYSFYNKGLLLEAMTHASFQELSGGNCYQRLEFLGDAVLDLLISQHLFVSYPGLSPGRLTALRSASVNNERFARVAVKHKFHSYLRHGSGFLLSQIQEFVKAVEAAGDKQKNSSYGCDGIQGPKVHQLLKVIIDKNYRSGWVCLPAFLPECSQFLSYCNNA
jgi:endoribonuclease Dicer